MGFPGGTVVKNLPANCKNPGSIPGSRRSPVVGNSNPLQYSCPKNPTDKRSQAGYSPQSHKKSDTTEHACNDNESSDAHQWPLKSADERLMGVI